MTESFADWERLRLVGNSLVSELCQRTDTPFKDEGNGHRREAIHQDDEKEHRE